MIGLIVVTHSRLAEEYLLAAEMIIGPFALARAISIDRGCCVEDAKRQLAETLAEIGGDGDGVMIMTDMFGGTPTNISAEFLQEGKVEILAGVNLPMVLKFVNARQGKGLTELAAMLKQYGQQTIMRPAELLQRPAVGKPAGRME